MDNKEKYLSEILSELKKLRQEVSNVSRQLQSLSDLESELRAFKRLYDKKSDRR